MKALLLSVATILGILSTAHAETKDISLRCEQGIGNLENPAPYLNLKGKIDATKRGELSDKEKSQLQLEVFDGTEFQTIGSSGYTAILKDEQGEGELLGYRTQYSVLNLEITVGETTYTISGTTPEAVITLYRGKTFFRGRPKAVGGGVCWGSHPMDSGI